MAKKQVKRKATEFIEKKKVKDIDIKSTEEDEGLQEDLLQNISNEDNDSSDDEGAAKAYQSDDSDELEFESDEEGNYTSKWDANVPSENSDDDDEEASGEEEEINESDIEDISGEEEADDNDDDDDDEEGEEEDEESLDSSDSEVEAGGEDDDEETVNITFVDGCQVIKNPNAESTKLQKSQTYTSIKEADQPKDSVTDAKPDQHLVVKLESPVAEVLNKDMENTVEKLQAEQRKLEEITKQLRKSVENLLADDDEIACAISDVSSRDQDGVHPKQGVLRTVETKTVIDEDGGKKTIVIETIHKPEGKPKRHATRSDAETGETIFNRLLHAGGDHKQIFDQQTGESVTTTTTTDADGTVTTTTTTISNVVKSGIPRAVLKSESNKSADNVNASTPAEAGGSAKQSKQKRKGKNGKK
uniref:Ribosome biogenesis protein BOP1 n=1 Tax=Ceratitis capitata TaxID=7213 RepID=W8BIR2_CERCA